MASDALTISDGTVSALITPAQGASLARFDYLGRGRVEPIFKPRSSGMSASALEPASILLVPFSNRVSGGGFHFDNRFIALAPNVGGDPFPLHGDGFSQPWEVIESSATAVRLRLISATGSPFRYDATIDYVIASSALTMTLGIVNRSDMTLPFGLGFHPWLVRTPDVELFAPASGVWPENSAHLRAADSPSPLPDPWDFNRSRQLPADFINNGFAGWPGKAVVLWPGRNLALAIEASDSLSTYIIYSPSAAADFFCFEPVSHPVDAFNLPGDPASHGLAVLAPGEGTVISVTFSPRAGA